MPAKRTQTLQGRLVTPQGLISGKIIFSRKIERIRKSSTARKTLIVPGFIDLHVHGVTGVDFMQGEGALNHMAKELPRFGTTAFLATTVTASWDELRKVFTDAAACMRSWKKESRVRAHCLGIHLEGPYINPDKLGAQPAHTRAFNLEEIKKLHTLCPIRVITLAPECLPDLNVVKKLNQMKIVVQLGHTNATYESATALFNHSRVSVTHLFNAMSPFHHRAPGAAGAALAHAEFAEIIPDLHHVHAGAILAARRAIPKMYFVSDATAAMAMPDGRYQLGDQQVIKCQGAVRLADGTLAGSCLTMDQAFRNALSMKLTPVQASQHASQYPAELLRMKNSGRLATGASADLLLLNSKGELEQIFCAGKLWNHV